MIHFLTLKSSSYMPHNYELYYLEYTWLKIDMIERGMNLNSPVGLTIQGCQKGQLLEKKMLKALFWYY